MEQGDRTRKKDIVNKSRYVNSSLYVSYLLKRGQSDWPNIMNSYAQVIYMQDARETSLKELETKFNVLSLGEAVEYEYTPPNTNIKLKRKIPYLDIAEINIVKDWIRAIEQTLKITN